MTERWKPENLETYFYVGRDFEAYNAIWLEDFPEKTRWRKGNCFKTKEAAEFAAEKVKALLLSLHDTTQVTSQVTSQVTTQVEKLPDWCKVGEWVWLDPEKILGNTGYKEVKNITGLGLVFADGGCVYFSDKIKQARLRPYNADEMRELVGKVVSYPDKSRYFIISCADFYTNTPCIYFGETWHTAEEICNPSLYQLDGKPCGVFEHLNDNGDWVK